MSAHSVRERPFSERHSKYRHNQSMPRPRIYHDSSSISPPSHHREPSTSPPRHVHFAPTPDPPHSSTSTPRPRCPRSILRLPAIPPPPPPPLLFPPIRPPTLPTVYILTYATSLTPNVSSFLALLSSQLPHRTPPIQHLYTINAATFPPPPRRMCEQYSGIAPAVQDFVMRHGPARVAVCRAVEEILAFGEQQQRRERVWRDGLCAARGAMEVALSVCCVAGTHRSVAVGEKIAQGVRDAVGREGGKVWVVVRHVHRVKGVGDPF